MGERLVLEVESSGIQYRRVFEGKSNSYGVKPVLMKYKKHEGKSNKNEWCVAGFSSDRSLYSLVYAVHLVFDVHIAFDVHLMFNI